MHPACSPPPRDGHSVPTAITGTPSTCPGQTCPHYILNNNTHARSKGSDLATTHRSQQGSGNRARAHTLIYGASQRARDRRGAHRDGLPCPSLRTKHTDFFVFLRKGCWNGMLSSFCSLARCMRQGSAERHCIAPSRLTGLASLRTPCVSTSKCSPSLKRECSRC